MSIKELDTKNLSNGNPRAPRVRGLLYLCIFLLSFVFSVAAGAETPATGADKPAPDAGIPAVKKASLITAWPGAEIYELCGHEALRIQGEDFDSVWNFGAFDFNEPNFVYRFVKGQTDYMVQGYPFAYFVPDYIARGSRIEEQVLNLTPQEVDSLQRLLQKYALPPLNRYRYNYIKNNCSTKIADLLDSVAGGAIVYPDGIRFKTYREAMRAYHKNYPWYQFGIDLALGWGLEEELSPRQELFIPVEFNRHAAKATLPDGRPLVSETIVINEGTDRAVEGPTPFLLTPLWFSIVILAFTVVLLLYCRRKNCIPKIWYAVFFGIEGLAGCLIAFLVFVSEHEATSPNLLIFWLNPLQLLVPVIIWWKQMKYPMLALMWLNVICMVLLLVFMPIFNRGQAGQISFILLIITDLLLSAYYLYAENLGKGKSREKRRRSGKKKSILKLFGK